MNARVDYGSYENSDRQGQQQQYCGQKLLLPHPVKQAHD